MPLEPPAALVRDGAPRTGRASEVTVPGSESPEHVTAPFVRGRKRRSGAEAIVMVTAYDAPFARFVDAGGVDIILVGDSLAEVVLGQESTLGLSIPDMAHHVRAVAGQRPRALVVADMPWMSYHTDPTAAVENAAVLVRAGAGAVKLEGGRRRVGAIKAIAEAEIPVMGHLGLTPQSLHAMGGYRVQGRGTEGAAALLEDAAAIEDAGCFAMVLEGVPGPLAETITANVSVPTIGIGAGGACDGQVLVLHDLLGMSSPPLPKFVRVYADLGQAVVNAVSAYASDVRKGAFPSESETYAGSAELRSFLEGG